MLMYVVGIGLYVIVIQTDDNCTFLDFRKHAAWLLVYLLDQGPYTCM